MIIWGRHCCTNWKAGIWVPLKLNTPEATKGTTGLWGSGPGVVSAPCDQSHQLPFRPLCCSRAHWLVSGMFGTSRMSTSYRLGPKPRQRGTLPLCSPFEADGIIDAKLIVEVLHGGGVDASRRTFRLKFWQGLRFPGGEVVSSPRYWGKG